ncbi:MAG TPA: xanthine dehydrogenase accessory protein XdhC [Rubrivivax sp.]|nr:xanthine dehydrogenase accessory protein XdhC [Burkholderiales bacterium]HNT38219.1 xanthine dehydrogenase accessory protein XdhC [Rubrivivax sp.]
MTEAALRQAAAQWLRAGRAAMQVQVLSARGSVPRPPGTRMLIAADEVLGTIGGGHLEWRAIDAARARLVAGQDEPVDDAVALGPTLGQCCGGSLVLRTARLTPALLAQWPLPAPRFSLQVYGAGHVGRAIVRLLEGLDCRVQWIDERETEFPAATCAPHIERVCVEPVEAEVATAPPGAFYLVLTHSHDLDLRVTEAILRRGDFGYLGLIGSKSKRARFLHRFEARGIALDVLARMVCPIGVEGVQGKEPEVIAVAVVAQLLQASA